MARFGSRRLLLAGLAGLMAFGSVLGMAASLGGVSNSSIGADSGSASSCDTDGVTSTYTTGYDATDARYEVTAVTVGAIHDDCDGKTVAVTLANSSGTSLGSGSTTVPTSAGSYTASVSLSSAADAEAVATVHVVISG